MNGQSLFAIRIRVAIRNQNRIAFGLSYVFYTGDYFGYKRICDRCHYDADGLRARCCEASAYHVEPIRFTLNLGAPYEPAFHWVDKYDGITEFNPERRSLDFAGFDGNPRHFYPNEWNNLGPASDLHTA